ncbi:MAG: reverse transcriptase domain-containing protein, partial [bacterium]
IFAMLEKGALEEVFGDPGLGFYSRLFLVPKKNGKLRPIIDLRRLNRMLVIPRFQMETIQSVWDALIPGNFSFSLDLSDAYFHIPIRKDFRKYLRIFFDGRVFQFKALPFGLSTSPWIFTKVMSEVKQ